MQSCEIASDDFLFVETSPPKKPVYTYKQTVNNTEMCLTRSCDGSLSLTRFISVENRKCYFDKWNQH